MLLDVRRSTQSITCSRGPEVHDIMSITIAILSRFAVARNDGSAIGVWAFGITVVPVGAVGGTAGGIVELIQGLLTNDDENDVASNERRKHRGPSQTLLDGRIHGTPGRIDNR